MIDWVTTPALGVTLMSFVSLIWWFANNWISR